jgi:MATE family multidrug resistance protein
VFLPGVLLAIFVWGGGVVAAMVCLVAWIALLAVAIAWRFRSGAWRRIQLVEEVPPVD